jgi:hypothetical protein
MRQPIPATHGSIGVKLLIRRRKRAELDNMHREPLAQVEYATIDCVVMQIANRDLGIGCVNQFVG